VKQSSQAKELEKACRIIAENIGEGLAIYNKNGVITFVNRRLCKMAGYNRKEVLGRKLIDFFKGADRKRVIEELEKTRRGESSRYSVGVGTNRGKEIFISISSVPILDSEGRFEGAVVVVSDITERKNLEDRLQERTLDLEKEMHKRTQLLADLYSGVAVTEERNRLAQEIHDFLSQCLATSILKMEVCEKLLDKDPQGVRKELCELKRLLEKSINSSREIIFRLRLPNFHRVGFCAVLKQYMKEFCRKTGIICEPKIKLETSLPLKTQVGIYRIIREAITNVRKHAMAKHINLRLETNKNGNLFMTIKDDGQGFNLRRVLSNKKYGKCFGLKGMKEQAELLAGTFTIETRKGQGTKIKVKVPLGEEYAEY